MEKLLTYLSTCQTVLLDDSVRLSKKASSTESGSLEKCNLLRILSWLFFFFFWVVLGIEPRASLMLGKCSTRPFVCILFFETGSP
jgi:hypothetical protein